MKYYNAGVEPSAPAKPIPSRIKEAREARGFTLDGFADALGVTKSAVAQYETGQITPSGELFGNIIRLTNQPPGFFTKQRPSEGDDHRPFWRSLKRMELHHRRRIVRRLAWAHDIVLYLDRFIDLPASNIPSVEFDFETADSDEIEEIAGRVRDYWGLGRGPIQDLVGVMELNGILVFEEPVECADMDAVSCWLEGRPFVLLSEEDRQGPRKNFNLAHELGHIVMHATVDLDSKNFDRVEAQANRFASAFLMPQESFGAEILGTSLSYLISLKVRWNVAIAAIGYRAKDLGILSKHQYGYLLRQMNARGIRKKEPYDDEIVVGRPSIIPYAINMLVEHGVQTKAQIVSALALNPHDVERLCGLSSGFLDDKVIDLKSALSLRQTDRNA